MTRSCRQTTLSECCSPSGTTTSMWPSDRFANHGDRSRHRRGLMVLADSQDFITFALVTDGTNISLTARTVTAGVATPVSTRPASTNTTIPSAFGSAGPALPTPLIIRPTGSFGSRRPVLSTPVYRL